MAAERRLKYQQIDRNQMSWVTLDIESLTPADHRAAALAYNLEQWTRLRRTASA